MGQKEQVARFEALLEAVFSAKVEADNDQLRFTYTHQKLFSKEYKTLHEMVTKVNDSGLLKILMKSYITAYDRNAARPNLIHYYGSDILFMLLVVQSGKVGDDTLLETWAAPILGKADANQSLRKRFLDLDPHYQRQVEIDIKREREKRVLRRSLIDLLRDAWKRQHEFEALAAGNLNPKPAVPTIDELRNFNPKVILDTTISGKVSHIQRLWLEAKDEKTDENLQVFVDSITDFGAWLRDQGRANVLALFQVTSTLNMPAELSVDEELEVLWRCLFALACIHLHGAALRAGLYIKNRKGFTKDELELFAKPIRDSKFYYRSNLLRALEGDLGAAPGDQMAAIVGLLRVYILVKSRLPDLTLLDQAAAMQAQSEVTLIREITTEISIASKSRDAARLQTVMSVPGNALAVDALRSAGSRKVTVYDGHELGRRELGMGADLGVVGNLGQAHVIYIARDMRVFIEFSQLKPFIFHAPDFWLANHAYKQKIAEIYEATIGIVHLTQIMFEAMGYLPVLIETGFAGLIYEIALNYASEEIGEVLSEIDPILGTVVAMAISTFAPRPNFHPKLNTDWVEHGDASLLAEKVNFTPIERGVNDEASGLELSLADNGVGAAERGTGLHSESEIDDIFERMTLEDEFMTQNCGIPLTAKNFNAWIAKFKKGAERIPNEWRGIIRDCPPLQKLIKAAWRDPEGKVRLVRIGERQRELLPFKYQKSVMASEHELWITLDGVDYKFDGIIRGENNKWFIGESKFTFKNMMEGETWTMDNLYSNTKADPASSYHFKFVDKAKEQFQRYSRIAKEFGFDGVAVMTNNRFLWATFEQELRSTKNVEIFLSRLEELPEFSDFFADRAAVLGNRSMRP